MKITDFDLEQYVLGELKSPKFERVQAEIQNSEILKAKVEQIKNSNTEVLKEMPAHLFTTQVQSQIERKSLEKPFFKGYFFHVASLFSVLIMMGIFIPMVNQNQYNNSGVWVSSFSSERVKGENFGMLIHKKTGPDVELLNDGDSVKQGDLLQISIKHLQSIYAVVVSVDGRGFVTKHFPNERSNGFIEGQGVLSLPYSYELDDAPLYEKFFLVTSTKELNADSVADQIKKNHLEIVDQEIVLNKGMSND